MKNFPDGESIGIRTRHLNSYEKLPLFSGSQPHCSLLFPSTHLRNVLTTNLDPSLLSFPPAHIRMGVSVLGRGLDVPTEVGARGPVGSPGLHGAIATDLMAM